MICQIVWLCGLDLSYFRKEDGPVGCVVVVLVGGGGIVVVVMVDGVVVVAVPFLVLFSFLVVSIRAGWVAPPSPVVWRLCWFVDPARFTRETPTAFVPLTVLSVCGAV